MDAVTGSCVSIMEPGVGLKRADFGRGNKSKSRSSVGDWNGVLLATLGPQTLEGDLVQPSEGSSRRREAVGRR